MERPFRSSEFPAIIHRLQFAKRFLLVGMLIQLLMLLPPVPAYANRIFLLVIVVSAVAGGAGFLIAYRVLDLKAEAMAASSLPQFFGPRVKARVIFFFMLAFLVPGLNLVILLWTWMRCSSAIRQLEALRVEAIAKEKQRGRLQGGVAEAFRSAP